MNFRFDRIYVAFPAEGGRPTLVKYSREDYKDIIAWLDMDGKFRPRGQASINSERSTFRIDKDNQEWIVTNEVELKELTSFDT